MTGGGRHAHLYSRHTSHDSPIHAHNIHTCLKARVQLYLRRRRLCRRRSGQHRLRHASRRSGRRRRSALPVCIRLSEAGSTRRASLTNTCSACPRGNRVGLRLRARERRGQGRCCRCRSWAQLRCLGLRRCDWGAPRGHASICICRRRAWCAARRGGGGGRRKSARCADALYCFVI